KTERDSLAGAEGNWPLYARTLAKAMETPPPKLPGFNDARGWPTKWLDLPQEWRRALNVFRPEGAGQKGGQQEGLHSEHKARPGQWKQLMSKTDKWPDFAVTATHIARAEKLKVDSQLGPNKPDHFAPVTRSFIEIELLPKLTESERKDLTAAEGKWP